MSLVAGRGCGVAAPPFTDFDSASEPDTDEQPSHEQHCDGCGEGGISAAQRLILEQTLAERYRPPGSEMQTSSRTMKVVATVHQNAEPVVEQTASQTPAATADTRNERKSPVVTAYPIMMIGFHPPPLGPASERMKASADAAMEPTMPQKISPR